MSSAVEERAVRTAEVQVFSDCLYFPIGRRGKYPAVTAHKTVIISIRTSSADPVDPA